MEYIYSDLELYQKLYRLDSVSVNDLDTAIGYFEDTIYNPEWCVWRVLIRRMNDALLKLERYDSYWTVFLDNGNWYAGQVNREDAVACLS